MCCLIPWITHTIDLDIKKLDQQLPDYLRALWTYATPLCIRFVFISFVEECLNIVLHMVAVIDQRVIKCRFIGEFSYSVSFLTIINFFSRSRNVRACLNRPNGTPQAVLVLTLNSSMFSEGADKFWSLISGSIPMVLMFITFPSSLLLTIYYIDFC